MIVPELNGNPKLFTKNTSAFPKYAKVSGRSSLKIKSNTATETTFATTKDFHEKG